MSLHDSALPAVDQAGGIARLMGDGALFARVLTRFRKEYRHAAAGIRAALDDGDLVLAQRLAHTLKGAAAMIEAVPLRQEAHALEQLLHNGAADPVVLQARAAQLARALERVLEELGTIEAALPQQPAAPSTLSAQPGACERALERLRTLLEDGNGDAVDLVRDAAGSLTSELGEDRYRRLAAAIEVFDFDGALALLHAG
jgi:HPt (histidine-containing phosphotransfer) domain-containing protein